MPIGLYALALAAFGIGLTEFGIVGLLPQVAADFSVSEPVAGYLVSGYALSVAVGAIGLTALLIRMERRRALMGLMALFIVGNLISATAESYDFLMLGRIVAALCHGAFFGLGAIVAAQMAGAGKQASAVALMFAGLTVSNIFGVPLGTFLGLQLGWRSTFWALAIIGIITMSGIRLLVPPTPVPAGTSLASEMGALRRPQVWISATISMLAFAGVIGAFTYIAFTITEVSGFKEITVPWLLVLFGAGTFIGNIVGGKAADKWLNGTLGIVLGLLALVLGVFALTAEDKVMTVISLLLMGAIGLATAPGLQIRIMGYAPDAPTIASGLNIAAFNVGCPRCLAGRYSASSRPWLHIAALGRCRGHSRGIDGSSPGFLFSPRATDIRRRCRRSRMKPSRTGRLNRSKAEHAGRSTFWSTKCEARLSLHLGTG